MLGGSLLTFKTIVMIEVIVFNWSVLECDVLDAKDLGIETSEELEYIRMNALEQIDNGVGFVERPYEAIARFYGKTYGEAYAMAQTFVDAMVLSQTINID